METSGIRYVKQAAIQGAGKGFHCLIRTTAQTPKGESGVQSVCKASPSGLKN
jgi:hypothetical protein